MTYYHQLTAQEIWNTITVTNCKSNFCTHSLSGQMAFTDWFSDVVKEEPLSHTVNPLLVSFLPFEFRLPFETLSFTLSCPSVCVCLFCFPQTSSCILDTQDLICAEQRRNASQSGLERVFDWPVWFGRSALIWAGFTWLFGGSAWWCVGLALILAGF